MGPNHAVSRSGSLLAPKCAWNQLPLNYLDTWTQQVDKVTTADIKAAFQRKLQPQTMATVVLGGTQAKP